ncbi:hypothetical protein [Caballeronia grimmiae]|uniref:hypothetical protein n=1 Tax=Caballeronia grimmiae TaxID=1071679 RepID=UPI0038B9A437
MDIFYYWQRFEQDLKNGQVGYFGSNNTKILELKERLRRQDATLDVAKEKNMTASAEVTLIPSNELVALLDFMVWEMTNRGRPDVLMWRTELLSRDDATSLDVLRAIAVCDDYLAPGGSEEGRAAQAIAWPNLSPK